MTAHLAPALDRTARRSAVDAEQVNSHRIRRIASLPDRRPADAARPSSWRALLLGAPPATRSR